MRGSFFLAISFLLWMFNDCMCVEWVLINDAVRTTHIVCLCPGWCIWRPSTSFPFGQNVKQEYGQERVEKRSFSKGYLLTIDLNLWKHEGGFIHDVVEGICLCLILNKNGTVFQNVSSVLSLPLMFNFTSTEFLTVPCSACLILM